MRKFTEKLFKIRQIIQERLDNPSRDLLYEQVSFKLDRSYDTYVKEIEQKTNYILSRNNYKVIKTLNRQVKEEEEAKKNKGKKKDDEDEVVFDLGEGYSDTDE